MVKQTGVYFGSERKKCAVANCKELISDNLKDDSHIGRRHFCGHDGMIPKEEVWIKLGHDKVVACSR